MPWELEIHIIDVGQGESSLIVARNPGPPLQQRTVLIDGGLGRYANTVHRYITQHPELGGVDHILVSHYDKDHSGGVLALLIADNLYRICAVLALAAGDAAAAAANSGGDQDHQIAAAAAAIYAAMNGAYDDRHNDHSQIAVIAGNIAQFLILDNNITDVQAADAGSDAGSNAVQQASQAFLLNPIIVRAAMKTQRAVWRSGGIAAGTTNGNAAARTYSAFQFIFDHLRNTVGQHSRFQTGGIYQNTHIIDIGNTNHVPDNYVDVVEGRFIMNNDRQVQAPQINRERTTNPVLGNEVLWNSGPASIAAPANSPALFVVARRAHIWNGPPNPIQIGLDGNGDSIGLILRFNQFFYYTGGDLPSQGEDLIANAIMANGLPNPAGGAAFNMPHRIACFKCGHHGSRHSTSQNFLNTIQPRGALISCGRNQFGIGDNHPEQNVINRLHNHPDIRYFYLTNCNYETNHVPASQGNDQLPVPGNKSRVAGQNDVPNLQAGRNRGNIRLSINQAESNSNNVIGPLQPGEVLRQYHVRYYDDDGGVQNFQIENIIF